MRSTVQLLQTVNIHQLISQNECAKNSKLTKTNKGYDAVCVCVCLCACMCARKKWVSILKEHNSVALILRIPANKLALQVVQGKIQELSSSVFF